MPVHFDSTLLGALRCFDMAGRHLSFTRAAEAMSLTQSAVSQQIRQLEDRLGYPLFVRRQRGLTFTPRGEQLHATVSRALGDIQQEIERLGLPASALQVNCLPSFALMPMRLTEFHRLQPDVSVRLKAEFQPLDRKRMDEGHRHRHPLRPGRLRPFTGRRADGRIPAGGGHARVSGRASAVPGRQALDGVASRRLALGRRGVSARRLALGRRGEFIEWRTWMQAHQPRWLKLWTARSSTWPAWPSAARR